MSGSELESRRAALLSRLYARRTFGIKLGLHVEEALLARLGNPERAYAVIHVAGTNGKGSVCAMLEAILRAGGIRTALYTSPHLVRINERIAVNGRSVPDDDLFALLGEVESLAEAVTVESGQEPTFFEVITAVGLEYFRRAGAQIAVVETGMGGRLDATNVVTPVVAAITGIGLEHTMYLGGDIESIAREKAGIIKDGRPVVCGEMDAGALNVVKSVARTRRAPLRLANECVTVRVLAEDLTGQVLQAESQNVAYGKLRMPLVGRYQAANLATALTVIEETAGILGIDIGPEIVARGLAGLSWPGRFQLLNTDPPIILDGAHNPPAATALADTLKRLLKQKPLGLVVGMCGDKDVGGFLRAFVRLAKKLWVVPIPSERNMPSERIRAAAGLMGWEVAEGSVADAVREARDWAASAGGAVCVTGSLYLVGEVLGGGANIDLSEFSRLQAEHEP